MLSSTMPCRQKILCIVAITLPCCLEPLDPLLLSEPEDGGAEGSAVEGGSACSGGVPDGWIQQGEECDDNNVQDGDGCSVDCKLQCEGLVDEVTGNCYFIASPGATGQTAWVACDPFNGPNEYLVHPMTIHSDDEAVRVENWLKATGLESVFVGLLADATGTIWTSLADKEPGYATDCPGCYQRWHPDEQPRMPAVNRAVVMSKAVGWMWTAVSPLSGEHGVICERNRPGRLENLCKLPGCDPVQVHEFEAFQHRYSKHNSPLSYVDARSTCEAWGGKVPASLLYLESNEERELIAAIGPSSRFWMGLTKTSNGTWEWADGVDASVRDFWATKPKNTDGVSVMKPTGSFDNHLVESSRGHEPLPYICKK